MSVASLIWLLACVSAGLWIMLGRSGPTANISPTPAVAQPARLVAGGTAAAGAMYRPIEQLQVGQRVVTPGTEPGGSLPTAVDRATWRLLTLELVSTWPDGTQDAMHVRTLQPPQWLAAHQVQVGARVPIPLDLREMGVPTNQPAEVVAVDPCPAIEDGPGRVVLTTVSHLNRFLFDLTVHGARAPPQSLEVTGWHKLYSEERQAWTSVCELHAGEVLRGRDGPLTVESLSRHPGVERVYNLTVEDEHQYYVSAADLLAHNANCTPIVQNEIRPYGDFKRFKNDGLAGHEVLQNSWLKAADRLEVRAENPSLALTKAQHDLVSSAQILAGLWEGPSAMGAMTAVENINMNIAILRSLSDAIGVNMATIDKLEKAALAFAKRKSL